MRLINSNIKKVIAELPERAIMSAWVKPWEANMELSWLRLNVGFGSFPWTLDAFDVNPSSLPNSTGYHGPPDYKRVTNEVNFYIDTSGNNFYHVV